MRNFKRNFTDFDRAPFSVFQSVFHILNTLNFYGKATPLTGVICSALLGVNHQSRRSWFLYDNVGSGYIFAVYALVVLNRGCEISRW